MALKTLLALVGCLLLVARAQDTNQDEEGTVCNPDTAELDDNLYRCIGMPCDANYQCFDLNCNSDLVCAIFESQSKFNGILAIIFSGATLLLILAVGVMKLYKNRLTSKQLRERLAGTLKSSDPKKRPSRLQADFTVRKKTVRSSRSGSTMMPKYQQFAQSMAINEDMSMSSSIKSLKRDNTRDVVSNDLIMALHRASTNPED